MLFSHQPIGIFDSGVGGLTVAHAVTTLLPHEKIIYFGDVAHHPYGEKSQAAIQAYTIKICDFFLSHQVIMILIACHSASSAAYDLAREYVGSKALVMNVIDPTLNYLRENFNDAVIGLIATRHTVNSDIYAQKIQQLHQNRLKLKALAAPLLVQLIEEGYAGKAILDKILFDYLSHPVLKNIAALILGCTHYPLIKKQIQNYYSAYSTSSVKLIDSAEITAQAVRGLFLHHHLLAAPTLTSPAHLFYVSDYTQSFVDSARFFFPDTLHFEPYPLWE